MRALAKDPLKRHQSMEELHEELQRCYGSVRYRRSIERSVAEAAAIPQKRNSVQIFGHHPHAARNAAAAERRHQPRRRRRGRTDPPHPPQGAQADDAADGAADCRRERRRPGDATANRQRRRELRPTGSRRYARRVVRAGTSVERRRRLGRPRHRRARRDVWIMGTLGGFPTPPAMGSREQERALPRRDRVLSTSSARLAPRG